MLETLDCGSYESAARLLILFNVFFFFFNDTATTEIYTLSLHDALPISVDVRGGAVQAGHPFAAVGVVDRDRKSTRLNSSHSQISYAVFCLKKKKKKKKNKKIEEKRKKQKKKKNNKRKK